MSTLSVNATARCAGPNGNALWIPKACAAGEASASAMPASAAARPSEPDPRMVGLPFGLRAGSFAGAADRIRRGFEGASAVPREAADARARDLAPGEAQPPSREARGRALTFAAHG